MSIFGKVRGKEWVEKMKEKKQIEEDRKWMDEMMKQEQKVDDDAKKWQEDVKKNRGPPHYTTETKSEIEKTRREVMEKLKKQQLANQGPELPYHPPPLPHKDDGPNSEASRAELAYPKVWNLSFNKEEPVKIFKKASSDEVDWDFFKFKVYVNEKDYFSTNFYENIEELKWKNTEKVKDIRKSKFTLDENFFNAVASMYVLTWKSGFSLENITYENNSKVLQSLCKFHLYFWFKRFQKQPDLLR